jgi:EmrB/QacA subfamily drug resistance transporter
MNASTDTAATASFPPAADHQGRPRLALALMVTAQFMVILDSAIVNVALPTIQHSLGFSAVGVEAVITAYATAFGGVLILGGRLADLFGHRRIFVIGLLAFGVTSLACGLANTPAVLISARIAQGLSAAILAPAALALLTTTFTEGAQRNRALGIFGAATSLGFVAGQILGGVLADTIGWRSIFIINVPVAVLAAVLARHAIASSPRRGPRQTPDVLGAVLITSAVALLVWAPTVGSEHGWVSAGFLVPVAAALVLLAVFVMVETKRRYPLVRLAMLRSRRLVGINLATAITGALNGAVVLLCTLFLQQAHHYSPLHAGLAFVPTGIAGLLAGARFAGPLVTRLGVRTVLTGALLISALAIGGLSFLPGGGDYLPLLAWLVVIGATFTTAAVATTVAVSSGVAAGEQGMAAALRQTAYQLGVALGVAVFLSIAAGHTKALLAHAGPPSHANALTAGFRLSLTTLSGLSALGAIGAFVMLGRREASRLTRTSRGVSD